MQRSAPRECNQTARMQTIRANATSPRAAHCIANNPRTVQRTARTGNQSCSNQTHVIPFACSSPVSPPPVRGDKRRGFHPGGGHFIRFVFDLSRYKLLVPGPHHRGELAKKKVSKKSYSEGFYPGKGASALAP